MVSRRGVFLGWLCRLPPGTGLNCSRAAFRSGPPAREVALGLLNGIARDGKLETIYDGSAIAPGEAISIFGPGFASEPEVSTVWLRASGAASRGGFASRPAS